MNKSASTMILAGLLLMPLAANSQQSEAGASSDRSFLQTGTWWNLYFDQENNPLRRGNASINAVKVLEIDQNRRSWIKITFPRSREDHFSIFGPAAKAHDNEDVSMIDAIAEWEKTVSEWKVMWVNLDFVVYVTRLEPGGAASGKQPIRSDTNSSSSAAGPRR